MLNIEQENFFQIIDIIEISEETEIVNCIDLTVDEDNSFVMGNNIISHNSALGSILQKRNPEKDGIYALKGKIKNCKNLGDLSENKEILEIMQILSLDPTLKGSQMMSGYSRIIIACDADCLDENTLIRTPSGDKKISEIDPGNFVISHSGEKKEVLNVVKSVFDEYIEIIINGAPIRCTRNHKIPIVREGVLMIETAENIRLTDQFLISK